MFPIDSKTRDYDAAMLDKFAALDKVKEYPWDIRDILPKVLTKEVAIRQIPIAAPKESVSPIHRFRPRGHHRFRI